MEKNNEQAQEEYLNTKLNPALYDAHDTRVRVLWLSVLERAKQEAEGKYAYWEKDGKRIKRDARKWLTRFSTSLCEVCELAGFDREQTLRLVEEMRRKYGKD